MEKQVKETMKSWKMSLAASLGAGLFFLSFFAPNYAQAQSTPAKHANKLAVFQKLEDKWSRAVVNPNQYTMDLLLAPSFVNISPSGDIETRDEYIAFMFAKGETEPYSMVQKVTSVRRFGDMAIVNGTYAFKISVNGMPHAEQGVFTHVFEKTPSGWRCVNSQRTNIPESKPAKAHKKKTKKRRHHLL